MYNQLVIFQI